MNNKITSIAASEDWIVQIDNTNGGECQQYREYCKEELTLLRKGISRETWQSQILAAKTFADLEFVTDVMQKNYQHLRPELRQILSSRFPTATVHSLDATINLALRLWLMINFQDRAYETLRHQSTCIDWDDISTLQERIRDLFPQARWETSPSTSRLGPHFTAAFMSRVCGLKIEWTTSLYDHLRLDRYSGILRIFPYKQHLSRLVESRQGASGCPIPIDVLRETLLSLDLLFPIWDRSTVQLLQQAKQTFHDTPPFLAQTKTLTLNDFNHWRDRLLELREMLDAPPVSWAQLYRDRRNPQQFWTFWIALLILALTVLSCLASFVQAWASMKTLWLAQRLSP